MKLKGKIDSKFLFQDTQYTEKARTLEGSFIPSLIRGRRSSSLAASYGLCRLRVYPFTTVQLRL